MTVLDSDHPNAFQNNFTETSDTSQPSLAIMFARLLFQYDAGNCLFSSSKMRSVRRDSWVFGHPLQMVFNLYRKSLLPLSRLVLHQNLYNFCVFLHD